MSEKIYIGNGKLKTFPDGGSIINIMLDLDGLSKHFENYGFTTEQGKKKLKLIVSERKTPDTYGNTHSVTVDTWKPDKTNQQTFPQQQSEQQNDFDSDEIPF